MKYISFIILLFLPLANLLTQPANVLQGLPSCDCDVLLITDFDDPGDPEYPCLESNPVICKGNLDKFYTFNNGVCSRSVYVESRYYESGILKYRFDYMVNDVYTLLLKYHNARTICFKGNFGFKESIEIRSKTIKLIDDSTISYYGDGNKPAIIFTGNGGSLDGGGEGSVRTDEHMSEGLIQIQASGAVNTNANYNQIKNITLVNSSQLQNPGPGVSAKQNRGIVLTNPPESFVDQKDDGTSYFTNMKNIDIEGFATGVHLRGFGNATTMSDVRFKNISAYGIWVSGGVDNSFSKFSFEACSNARAIRLDNFVDERYSDTNVGGEHPITLSDPNIRAKLETDKLLKPLLDGASDQSDFNAQLEDLRESIVNNGTLQFFSLAEGCQTGDEIENYFINKSSGNPLNIKKFGLFGYGIDLRPLKNYENDESAGYENYPEDGKDIIELNNLYSDANDPSNNGIGGTFSFYKSVFTHPLNSSDTITLEQVNCDPSAGLTDFLIAPLFNSFTQVNIYIGNNKQVDKLVEIQGREDDEELCIQNSEIDPTCKPCSYLKNNGTLSNSLGFRNNIQLCSNPENLSDSALIDRSTIPLESLDPECDLTNGPEGKPVLTITHLQN